MKKQFSIILAVVFFCLLSGTEALGFDNYPVTASARSPQPMIRTAAIQATGWAPNPLIVGAERQHIKSMHILQRPNRPLHFYGNTVRFLHYRRVARGVR